MPGGPKRALRAKRAIRLADVQGASRLVIELTLLVTGLVETVHHNIVRHPGIRGAATLEPTSGITGLVYRSIRGITRLVGGTIDVALAPLVPLFAEHDDSPRRDAVVAALNGVLGDRLAATGNPLALPMRLCAGGVAIDLEPKAIAKVLGTPRERVVVLVHGLCMNDRQWKRGGHDHGKALARDLAANALYLRYNSGQHISTNGAEFADLLDVLVASWPVPLREIVLVGHSMGGLVIRSAFAVGEAQGQSWPGLVRALVLLGAPHHGAPLERGGHGLDKILAASPYTVAFTRLPQLRSAGITDLRHGSVQDADWADHGRFDHATDRRHPLPLPAGVPCYAVAASLEPRRRAAAHPAQAPRRRAGSGRQRARPASEPEDGPGCSAGAAVGGLGHRSPRSAAQRRGVPADQALARCQGLRLRGAPTPRRSRNTRRRASPAPQRPSQELSVGPGRSRGVTLLPVAPYGSWSHRTLNRVRASFYPDPFNAEYWSYHAAQEYQRNDVALYVDSDVVPVRGRKRSVLRLMK